MNGCVTDSAATNGNDMDRFDNADPEADALAALEKRDFRFMALSLRGTVIPGIDPAKTRRYELRCGVIFMQGISDAVRSQEQLEMMKKAHTYATKYNAVIKERCIP